MRRTSTQRLTRREVVCGAAIVAVVGVPACGGGSDEPTQYEPPVPDPWTNVASAIQSAQPRFPGGLAVEVMTSAGVVYSGSFGGFTNTTHVLVRSASKMVSATVLLRLVEQGALALDTTTQSLLVDRQGRSWSGNMGAIRLRHLLSFTAGISAEVPGSDDDTITLTEAVHRIHEDQSSAASPPGSQFFYGGATQLRIAARMAEIATGKSWRQLFYELLRLPLGFGVLSTYGNGTNPNPARDLVCTGLEYTRFLTLQLRQGLDGSTRLVARASIAQQREDAFGLATTILYSPYKQQLQKDYHYGFGNWLETANGAAPGPGNPVNRWSCTGQQGWAPWIAADGSYAAIIMTRQADLPTSFLPSEALKSQIDPLIRSALASSPPVVRTVP